VATATLARDLGRRALRARSAALVSITIPAGLPHFAGEEGRLRRQAVSAAVDRDRIVREALGSTAEPARDVTAPSLPGWTGSTPGAQVLTHDAARARRLWAQADRISPWSGPFTISYAADSGQQEEVDAITRDVAATLRVDARGTPYPSQAALEADVGERIVGGAWLSTQRAPYPSRLGMLSAWCTSGASGNDGNYRDGEVDALVARAASAPTAAAAAALVDRAQTVLLRDLPVIPLWYPGAVGGRSAMVSGVRFGWDGLLRYDEIAKR
jgi:oligopeptide transport system substrate-binding protein